MPAFSGLKAMGIAPKSVEDYYGEAKPVGWSIEPMSREAGYSTPVQRPYYSNPVEEQRRAMAQMAQQYQYNRMQSELQNLPEVQKLEDIERQERLKSGLERLQMLGQKEAFQNRLQKGELDYWTPEGRREMAKAVGMGIITPSSLQAIRASSPQDEALSEAIYNLNTADSEEKLKQIIEGADKSLHVDPEFRRAIHEARSNVAAKQSQRDNTLIQRAIREGMPYNEMMKYLNPEIDQVVDRSGFMKSYGEHLLTKEARDKIVTPAWQNQNTELMQQAVERSINPPTSAQLEGFVQSKPGNETRDFTRNPLTPEEMQAAAIEWKAQPSRLLAARRKMEQDYIDQYLGRTPQVQAEPQVEDKKAKAMDLLKSRGLIK